VREVEEQVLGALSPDYLLDCLEELVAIPTLSGGETPAQEAVAGRMREIGLGTDVWAIDFETLRSHPAYTAEIERDSGLGVVGSMGRGDGPTLILNGHVDVVEAGEPDRWTSPPFEARARGGRVYGRGTCDMKGGLCCALAVARAIADAGVDLQGTLQLQSVIGEEDGGAGTLATLVRGHTGQGAVVLEPTGLAIGPAHGGALGFRVTVPGLAAHGAFREEGVSPIEPFGRLVAGLRELEAERNRDVSDPLFADDALPFALAIGKVRSGIWASTVPESLEFEGRLGFPPGEDPEHARRAFEAAVSSASADDPWLARNPPVVEWSGAQFGAARTDPDSPVVRTLEAAFGEVTQTLPLVRGMRYGSDMRLLVAVGGIPTVHFGPGDVRDAHRPDENVLVEELITAARVVAVAALRFCGVAGG